MQIISGFLNYEKELLIKMIIKYFVIMKLTIEGLQVIIKQDSTLTIKYSRPFQDTHFNIPCHVFFYPSLKSVGTFSNKKLEGKPKVCDFKKYTKCDWKKLLLYRAHRLIRGM